MKKPNEKKASQKATTVTSPRASDEVNITNNNIRTSEKISPRASDEENSKIDNIKTANKEEWSITVSQKATTGISPRASDEGYSTNNNIRTSKKNSPRASDEVNITNNNIRTSKTKVAIATAAGVGGVAIVRLSGEDAFEIARKVLYEKDGTSLDIGKQEDRKMRLCRFKGEGVMDKVMCVFFYAPHSYTGENVVEIQMHGSSAIASAAVRALISSGAEGAEAGEFTRQAFMNGKIDLTEAEGIADLIAAEGEAQINAAYEQSEGALKQEMDEVFESLTKLAALSEAAIDYPEEDLEEATTSSVEKGLEQNIEKLEAMKASFKGGALVREGVKIVLAGETNVGKSQLLNKLLMRNRAIVSATAGTTRDTIEESFTYRGIKFIICDTAGIRETSDEVEKIGVNRTLAELEAADIILAVSEAGKPFDLALPKNKKVIYIQNKADILSAEKTTDSIVLSALTGENIDALKNRLYETVMQNVYSRGAAINNMRQYSCVCSALECLHRAKANIYQISLDCIVSDIMHAATHIGEVTGKRASEAVIHEIFARFCVGK